MLTVNQKETIRLEEVLRHEIRTELAKAEGDKKVGGPFVKFLNTALGLWLLSAIFISGAGAIFTNWQQKHSETLKEKDAVERLDLEISHRFSQVLARLYELTDKDKANPKLKPPSTESDVKKVLDLLWESPAKGVAPIYPEYSGYGLPSLLAELRRHTEDQELRRDLDIRLAAITGRQVEAAALSDVTGRAGAIIESYMLPRWKSGWFYFTDCPKSAPFC